MAAAFYQLGVFSIPTTLVLKARTNGNLSETEMSLLEDIPFESARLLSQIPRLQGVAQIIRVVAAQQDNYSGDYAEEATIIKIVREFTSYFMNTGSLRKALEKIRSDRSRYPAHVLTALEGAVAKAPHLLKKRRKTREVSPELLRPGQELVCNVYTSEGKLLITDDTVLNRESIEIITYHAKHGGLSNRIRIKRE